MYFKLWKVMSSQIEEHAKLSVPKPPSYQSMTDKVNSVLSNKSRDEMLQFFTLTSPLNESADKFYEYFL